MLDSSDVQTLSEAIRRIAYGDKAGATGLELVARSLDKIATAIDGLADAIRQSKEYFHGTLSL